MTEDTAAAAQPICYLKGIDVTTLSKKDRRRLTKQAKKELNPKVPTPQGKKQKPKLTHEQRKEKFTALAVKAREKQQKREQQRSGYQGKSSYSGGNSAAAADGPNAEKLYCLGCRGKGHVIKDCKKSKSNTIGMCFNCGSTEHTLHSCKEKKDKSGKLPFAECFVCGQKGHLSGQCSQNEHGIYPKGGCCKICSSKFHLASQCPDLGSSKDRHSSSSMQNSSEHSSSSSSVQAGVKRPKRTVFIDDDDALNTGGDAIGDKFDFEVPEPAADDSEAAVQPPPQKKAKKAKIVKF
jgi:zinc finger CCHC domain-containing protein 9